MQCTEADFLEPLVSLDWQLVKSIPQADLPLNHNCLLKQKQHWLGSLCESVNFCFCIFYFPQLSSGFPVLSESTPLIQIASYFNLSSHNSCDVGTVSLYTSNFSDMLHLGHLRPIGLKLRKQTAKLQAVWKESSLLCFDSFLTKLLFCLPYKPSQGGGNTPASKSMNRRSAAYSVQ